MTFDDIWRHLMSGRGNVGGSFKNSRYFWHSAWGHTLEHCHVRCIACLPQVVHDANAVSSMYAQCHICRMAVLHDGTHCIRAMQYGVHWTPYCMNAMHLIRQHPPATGITLMQYGMQCIHANRQAMRNCHIPTDALPCDETKKSRQIWNKSYTLNSSLWRESLYLSL